MASDVLSKCYSGKTADVLRVVRLVAEQMIESGLTEAEIYLPFSDGDATIRLKRPP